MRHFFGIEDEEFIRGDVPMTKREIRMAVLNEARSWRRHGPHHQKAHSDELHRHAHRHHHTADPFGHLYRELSFVPGHRRFRAHAIAGQPGQHGHRRSAELSVPPVRAGHRHLRRHPQLQPVRRRPARCIRPEAEKLNERKGRTHE